jgi:hypothetical protein
MLYATLVFTHVVGAAGLFSAIAIEALSLRRLQQAETPADARLWLGVLAVPGRLGPASMLVTVLSGIAVAAMGWRHQAWMVAALVAVIAMGALAGGVTKGRMRILARAIAGESGPRLSGWYRVLLARRALEASLRVRVALGVGILGLMTVKPGTAGSVLLLAGAAAAGALASAVAPTRRARSAAAEGTSGA